MVIVYGEVMEWCGGCWILCVVQVEQIVYLEVVVCVVVFLYVEVVEDLYFGFGNEWWYLVGGVEYCVWMQCQCLFEVYFGYFWQCCVGCVVDELG